MSKTLKQIVEAAKDMMKTASLPRRLLAAGPQAGQELVLREPKPDNVTDEMYKFWPAVKFTEKDGKLFYTYDPWAGKAVPHVRYVYVYKEITQEMIDEDDFDGLRGIRDDWVMKALGLEEARND